MTTSPCVNCGACCKKTACGFGKYDHALHQCKHLKSVEKGGNYEFYTCGIYADIIKDPTAVFSPAFGAGCCMSMFNSERERNIRALNNE